MKRRSYSTIYEVYLILCILCVECAKCQAYDGGVESTVAPIMFLDLGRDSGYLNKCPRCLVPSSSTFTLLTLSCTCLFILYFSKHFLTLVVEQSYLLTECFTHPSLFNISYEQRGGILIRRIAIKVDVNEPLFDSGGFLKSITLKWYVNYRSCFVIQQEDLGTSFTCARSEC